MQCTYRLLADDLAEAGYYGLRIDYDGWGDSSGSWDDPGRVEAWLSSIDHAVNWAKSSGADKVLLVGTELGALLASAAADRIEQADGGLLDGLVLWDPSWNGRTFLREQQVVHQIMVGSPSVIEGSKEGPGFVFKPSVVDELTALDFAKFEGSMAKNVLVLTRKDRPAKKQVTKQLSMPNVEVDPTVDSHDVIYQDVGGVLRDPVDRIVKWVRTLLDGEEPFSLEFDANPTAVIEHLPGGKVITETATAIGSTGMFGIITDLEEAPGVPGQRSADGPVGGAVQGTAEGTGRGSAEGTVEHSSGKSISSGPTAFFMDAGTIDHVGPAHLWVDFARKWASRGVRSCRFDFSGLGDSPLHPGQRFPTIRSPHAFDDLREVIHAVVPEDPQNVVLVGTCSGSYQAIEGSLTDHYRHIVAINPRLFFGSPELSRGKNDPRRAAQQTNRKWVRLLIRPILADVLHRKARMLDTAKWPIQIQYSYPWIPAFVWGIINLIFLRNSPASTFGKLHDKGVTLFLIIGELDMVDLSRGDMGAIKRLDRSGRIKFKLVPGLDHGLHACGPREEMFDQVTEHVLGLHPEWSGPKDADTDGVPRSDSARSGDDTLHGGSASQADGAGLEASSDLMAG
jgi:alpha-beta hydrolase superfamily lysophospholipase